MSFATIAARGCGKRRTPGGLYAECGLSGHGSPLEAFLVDPPIPLPTGLDLINKPQLWDDGRTGLVHLLLWIGEQYYPHVSDYIEECLPPGALIATETGLRPVEAVQSGDLVLTHTGRKRPVCETTTRAFAGELVTVDTAYWPLPLRVTPEHPVFRAKVLRGRARRKAEGMDGERILERSFVPARDLEQGDYLCYPIQREERDVETVMMSYVKEYTTVFSNSVRTAEVVARAQALRVARAPVLRMQRLLLERLAARAEWSLAEVRSACAELYRHDTALVRGLTVLCAKGLLRRVAAAHYVVTEEGRTVATAPYMSFRALGKTLGMDPSTAQKAVLAPERRHTKTVQVTLTPELMRLIGYYLAEGSVANTTQNAKHGYYDVVELSFGLVSDDEERGLAEEASAAARASGFSASVTQKQGCWHVLIYSRFLAHWLVGEFGKGARHKYLPSWALALPIVKLQALLEAYIACDGYVTTHQRHATTASLQLAFGVAQAANRCGWRAAVTKRRDQDQYDITCYSGIGTDVFSDGEYLYLPIRDVRQVSYTGPVYNFAVEDDESYCVGYHAVHNCRRFGASRRIPNTLDLSRLTPGRSRMILAHPRARLDNWHILTPPTRCRKRVPLHAVEVVRALLDDGRTVEGSVVGQERALIGGYDDEPEFGRFGQRGPCLFKAYDLIPADDGQFIGGDTDGAHYLRTIADTSYAYTPSGEEAKFSPAIFAALPLHGFSLVKDGEGNVNGKAKEKVKDTGFDWRETDE
jgi:intein/homing endonuclease